jgi:hypothetical protein
MECEAEFTRTPFNVQNWRWEGEDEESDGEDDDDTTYGHAEYARDKALQSDSEH